jgi:hypothetical protein
MIAARSLHSNSQRSDTTYRTKQAGSASSLSGLTGRELTQETNMELEYTQQSDQVTVYQSNFRAEDGPPAGRANAFYEGVIVPLASLFAVALFVAGAMLLNR